MCIGLPMKVVKQAGEFAAICTRNGEEKEINMQLVGMQPVGTWIMVFIDAARAVVSSEEADRTNDALVALDIAMNGGGSDEAAQNAQIEHLFADLIDREPVNPFLDTKG